jgi:hypothetical protein
MRLKWLMDKEGGGAGGGTGGDDWRTVLPEDLRADPTVTSYKTLADFVKGAIETKSFVGKSIRPPGPDASADAKKEFVTKLLAIDPALIYAPDGDPEAADRLWKKLGKPGKPEEYEVPKEAEEAGLNAADLRALAVTGGLTRGQFKGLVDVMVKGNLETRRVAALERLALDQEWGEAKEERLLGAKAAAMKMGLTEAEAAALSPKQLRAFHNVAKAVGVNKNEFRRINEEGSGHDVLDRDEAFRQMAEIRENPHYFDAFSNPAEHKRLVAQMSKLGKAAYGE